MFWVVLHFQKIFAFINTKQPFQKDSAVIVSQIDNVNKFVLIATAIIESGFKTEYFFRTFSVESNVVTSLEFHSDLC